MKKHILLGVVASFLLAADVPRPRVEGGVELPDGVTHVSLPAGTVTWENVRNKDSMTVRVSAGGATVEGRRLYYGDGTLAMEVAATAEGMHFVHFTGITAPSRMTGNLNGAVKHGIVIDGTT